MNKHTKFGKELIEAMNEVLDHKEGRIELLSREVKVPLSTDINVKAIRQKYDLSQSQFAKCFGFSLSSVKDWEQGRRKPERAARMLLYVIDKAPKVVHDILSHIA